VKKRFKKPLFKHHSQKQVPSQKNVKKYNIPQEKEAIITPILPLIRNVLFVCFQEQFISLRTLRTPAKKAVKIKKKHI
jgi:hypothetical protein